MSDNNILEFKKKDEDLLDKIKKELGPRFIISYLDHDDGGCHTFIEPNMNSMELAFLKDTVSKVIDKCMRD